MPPYGLMDNEKDYGSETLCAYNGCKEEPKWTRLADHRGPGLVYVCHGHKVLEGQYDSLLKKPDYTRINVDVPESPAVIAHLLKAVARG